MGFPKAGSSALQQFFNINQDILLKNGILFPQSGKTVPHAENHFRAYFCFMEHDHHLCPKNIKSPEEEWGKIIREGENISADIFISSEALMNLSKEHLYTIKKIVRERYIIKPIIYIRRVDEFITSLCNQLIKEAELTSSIINIDNQSKLLNKLFAKIRDISDVFSKDNIIVRPYEKEQFYNNSIFADFLHYGLNMELTDEFRLPNRIVNISLGKDSIEYKKIVNFLPITLEQKNKSLPGLLKYRVDKKEERPKLSSNKDLLKLIEQVKEEEQWIAREILGKKDGKIFYGKLPDENENYQPYEGLDFYKIMDISKYILMQTFPYESEEEINHKLKNIYQTTKQNTLNEEVNKDIIRGVMSVVINQFIPQN